ncbi:MAG TPA: substrate-binding domain-containing protein [Jatrophihabitantaceae bacterium]
MASRPRRRPSGSPTLTTIAKAAGVTVPTVSKVLNGRSDVSATVRQEVGRLLRQSGYHVSMPGRDSAVLDGLVDLVLPGVEGSWASAMVSGVERVVSKADRDLVVTVARDDAADQRDWVHRLIGRGSRGAVLALVTPTPAQHSRLVRAGVRLVALDPGIDVGPGIATVGATNWAGGYSATEHLIRLGHERIAAIAGLAAHRYSQARIDGYRSALAAAGLVARPELVRHGDWSRALAERQAARLLQLRHRPTAIFACSDRMALGVYDAAAALNVRIPDELSVVGFDDLVEAQWLTPGLTTMRQPVREMAAAAARTLLQLIDGERPDTHRLELATTLIERQSTAPAPG